MKTQALRPAAVALVLLGLIAAGFVAFGSQPAGADNRCGMFGGAFHYTGSALVFDIKLQGDMEDQDNVTRYLNHQNSRDSSHDVGICDADFFWFSGNGVRVTDHYRAYDGGQKFKIPGGSTVVCHNHSLQTLNGKHYSVTCRGNISAV